IGTPLFKEAIIHLENGKTFTIRATNPSPINKYIKSAKLDGRSLTDPFLGYYSVMVGGKTLEFEMTDKPQTQVMAVIARHARVLRESDNFAAVPIIDGPRTFRGTATIKMNTVTGSDPGIVYTLDGSTPTEKSKGYADY